MKKIININKILWLFVLTPLLFTCENDDDAVIEKVVAGFVHTIDQSTGMVSFLNLSENADSYIWNFGDDTSSTLINPEKTYATGTYTIMLTAKNAFSSSTFTDQIVINIPLPINFPVTFDDPNVDYDVATFGGVAFEIVDNPDPSGTNPDVSKVGAITNSGANWEGITFPLGVPLDLSVLQTVKINFWSDAPISILLKLEDGTEANIETTASHGGTGWEELFFTFNSAASYSRVTIFVDGPGTATGTFYFDDVEQVETPPTPCTPETTENIDPANGDINWTFMTNDVSHTFEAFGDTGASIVTNPVFDGINPSCNVQQFVKTAGCQTWAGMGTELATALDFTGSINKLFKMKVLAETQVTDVTLRLERLPFPDTDPAVERVASITSVGEWEELTFDFSDVTTGTYKSVIIYFERDAACDGDVYYFDDLIQTSGGSGGGSGGGSFDDGLLTNGDFEDGATAWVGNAANVQTEGGNSFNFADVMTAGDAFAVNLSQIVEIVPDKSYTLTFDASSDRDRTILAGIGLNEAPWTAATETVNLTASTQNFVLNLTSTGFGIPNSRVLFDMGAEVGVVVIDNVSLVCNDCDGGSGGGGGGGGGGNTGDNLAANGDFETGDETGWLLFQNGGTVSLDNSTNNGGSWSGKLTVGESGGNPAFKQERIGAGTVSAGDTVQIQFDHTGTVVQPGAAVNVLLFGEGAGGTVPFTHIFNPAPELSGSWTTFIGTYTIPDGTDVSEGISFLIETVCGAVSGCSVTMNIDNVTVTLNP